MKEKLDFFTRRRNIIIVVASLHHWGTGPLCLSRLERAWSNTLTKSWCCQRESRWSVRRRLISAVSLILYCKCIKQIILNKRKWKYYCLYFHAFFIFFGAEGFHTTYVLPIGVVGGVSTTPVSPSWRKYMWTREISKQDKEKRRGRRGTRQDKMRTNKRRWKEMYKNENQRSTYRSRTDNGVK